MSFFGWLEDYLRRRREKILLHRFGGIQTCPWCRQCAQRDSGWSFKVWDRDPFLDVLTCSVCSGTSLWKFEIGMFFIGGLDPPKPAWENEPHYDVVNARLKMETM